MQKIEQQVVLQGIDLDMAISEYLANLEMQDLSRHTIINCRSVIQQFRQSLRSYPCTPDNATRYMADLRDHGKARGTLQLHKIYVRQLLQYLSIDWNYKIRGSRRLPSYTAIEDVRAVLYQVAIRSDRFRCRKVRDYLLISMLAYTGLRRSELAGLRVRDIDLHAGLITVCHGKGDKDRVIPISKNIAVPLTKHLDGKAANDSIFGLTSGGIWWVVNHYAREARVTLHPHSFRHFFRHSPSRKGGRGNIEINIGAFRSCIDCNDSGLSACVAQTSTENGSLIR